MTDLLKQAGFKSAQEARALFKKLGMAAEAADIPSKPIKVKPENIRKIARALNMHRKGHTHRVISSKLNVPISTVGKWIREGK